MRVVVFGTFDRLHPGHDHFFRQARALGSRLVVVVARDSWIRENKKREPREREEVRQQRVAERPGVDRVLLGDEWPCDDPYRLLGVLEFDVVALGYDQEPANAVVRTELDKRGKEHVKIVRLKPYRPLRFKSSFASV